LFGGIVAHFFDNLLNGRYAAGGPAFHEKA